MRHLFYHTVIRLLGMIGWVITSSWDMIDFIVGQFGGPAAQLRWRQPHLSGWMSRLIRRPT